MLPPQASSSCRAAVDSDFRVNTGNTAHWVPVAAASWIWRALKLMAVMENPLDRYWLTVE